MGYLVPHIQMINHTSSITGIVRGIWKRVKKNQINRSVPSNPLIRYNTGFHSSVRALLFPLGTAHLEMTTVNVSAEMEIIANTTADAIGQLQTEVKSLKEAVFQNRKVLDMITAQMGGVCTLANTSCCTSVDQSGQTATDIHTIWQRAGVLHEVTKDDTSWTTHLRESLTAWLPNFNWLKQLFMRIFLLGIIILCACVFSQCFLWYCKRTTTSYDDRKSCQLRHKIEKGTYFRGMHAETTI